MSNIANKLKTEIISFESVFRYRSVWMFLAIVWVVLAHSSLTLPSILSLIKDTGYGGVDIFLLASGIGCFFSLNKNSNIKDFLRRRMKKIMPMQMVFLTIFFITTALTSSISEIQIIGNIFGLGLFAGLNHQFNWYIGAMWVCYFIAPIFKSMVYQTKPFNMALILLGLCLTSTLFFYQFELIFWTRLPIFFLGIAVGEISTRKKGLTLLDVIIVLVTMLIGVAILYICIFTHSKLLWNKGFFWYPFILITPGLTLIISIVSRFLSKTKCKFIVTIMDTLGKHTFPVYLSHIFIFGFFEKQADRFASIGNLVYNLLAVFASVLFAIVLVYLTKAAEYVLKRLMGLLHKVRI